MCFLHFRCLPNKVACILANQRANNTLSASLRSHVWTNSTLIYIIHVAQKPEPELEPEPGPDQTTPKWRWNPVIKMSHKTKAAGYYLRSAD